MTEENKVTTGHQGAGPGRLPSPEVVVEAYRDTGVGLISGQYIVLGGGELKTPVKCCGMGAIGVKFLDHYIADGHPGNLKPENLGTWDRANLQHFLGVDEWQLAAYEFGFDDQIHDLQWNDNRGDYYPHREHHQEEYDLGRAAARAVWGFFHGEDTDA